MLHVLLSAFLALAPPPASAASAVPPVSVCLRLPSAQGLFCAWLGTCLHELLEPRLQTRGRSEGNPGSVTASVAAAGFQPADPGRSSRGPAGSPVPEPATLAIVGSGLIGIVLLRRRRSGRSH